MIVVDASVAAKWFTSEAGSEAADNVLKRDEALIGPDFVIFETLNVLRRKHKHGELTERQLSKIAEELVGFFDQLVPARSLISRAVTLSLVLNHGVYDCAYLACAIQHQAPMITADGVFARKAIAAGFQASVTML